MKLKAPADARTWELYAMAALKAEFGIEHAIFVRYDFIPRTWDGCVYIEKEKSVICVNRFLWKHKSVDGKKLLVDHELAHVVCNDAKHGKRWYDAHKKLSGDGVKIESVISLPSAEYAELKKKTRCARTKMFNQLLTKGKSHA